MRKSVRLIKTILVLLIVISFTQCDEDDVTPKTINTVKMDGNDYAIASATMIGMSIDDFGSTSISFMSGTGLQSRILSLNVESFTAATIEGEYAFPEVTGKKLLDDWLTDYSYYEGTEQYSSNLETGEVSITHNSGNNYTVSMDLVMIDGVTFTGLYTGDFQVMFSNH
ncbi:MAG TPA: hypothetical protein DCG75_17965 [Bacteroidales bacterium]|nr:hypothetical protein [Bacteroidales bacterium]